MLARKLFRVQTPLKMEGHKECHSLFRLWHLKDLEGHPWGCPCFLYIIFFIYKIFLFFTLLLAPPSVTSRKLQIPNRPTVSVVLMVSADTCTQVVQGSNPTENGRSQLIPQPFSAVVFKRSWGAPVRVPILFVLKNLPFNM